MVWADHAAGHLISARRGPISPHQATFLLAEATWRGVHTSGRIRAYYERVLRGDVERRKIALIATAHSLTRVMLSMLQTGECWRETIEATEAVAA